MAKKAKSVKKKKRRKKKQQSAACKKGCAARKSKAKARHAQKHLAQRASKKQLWYCVPQVDGAGKSCYTRRGDAEAVVRRTVASWRASPQTMYTSAWNERERKWEYTPCSSNDCGPGAWTTKVIQEVRSKRDPSWID